MPGISGLLEIGRRGLSAQRLALNVTSQNIANATTLGYSRQRVSMTATTPLQNAQGLFIGTGVDVTSINRIRDSFVDSQIRQSNGTLGSATTRQGVLSEIESTLGEPGDNGLQSAMTKFFNSFQALSTHPEDSAPRNDVLTQANKVVASFNRIRSNYTAQLSNLSDDATSSVSQINTLTRQIAQLNLQITSAKGLNSEPSDLMDQRDLAIDQLSQLASIAAIEDSRGAMLVSIGGTLVASGAESMPLRATVVSGTMKITDANGQSVQVTGGKLGGMMEMYNTTIPAYSTQLDALASKIISRVNTVQAAGYGLGTPPPTGINFFTGTDAGSIAINTQISSNINNIAASGDGAPGNNANALALYGIMNEALLDGNTTTVSQYYSRYVSSIGSAVTSSTSESSSADLVLAQLDAQRQSVSGVSIDEEMTNMIKYQRSFDAASRVITTADELMKTILSMLS